MTERHVFVLIGVVIVLIAMTVWGRLP